MVPFISGMKKLFSGQQTQQNISQRQGQAGFCKDISSDAVYKGTNRFDVQRRIGSSRYGTYYYWELRKRISRLRFWEPKIRQGGCLHSISLANPNPTDILNAEVHVLELANHIDVIRPIGKCVTSYDIIYEHCGQLDLDSHLKRLLPRPQRQGLDWLTRIQIAKGIADGLEYIHETLSFIHTDIRAEHVFLDDHFVPKLACFGFARKVIQGIDTPENPVRITWNPEGISSCLAPELRSGFATTKTDVYAYGTLLIYLFTGSSSTTLVDRVRLAHPTEDFVRSIVDPSLGAQFSSQGLVFVFEAAKLCINADPSHRLSIRGIQPILRSAARC